MRFGSLQCGNCYFLQAYLAILFALVIDIRPDIILLREVGSVYLTLTSIFFSTKKHQKLKKLK
jgi:hypothetical protein